MWELVRAGGPFMAPIILCSIAAVGILLERLWTLQRKRVLPEELIKKLSSFAEGGQVTPKIIEALEKNSPLGRVLAAALANRDRGREKGAGGFTCAFEESCEEIIHRGVFR